MSAARSTSRSTSRPVSVAALLARVGRVVARWHDLRATRRALARLDAHALRDIGLSAEARDAECARPFWRD